MALLEVNKVKKIFNGEALFDNVTFSVNKGNKVALIGNNGVGKTTLLKMILNQIDIDGGNINIAHGSSVGYLSQVMINSFENTLYEEMLLSFKDVLKMKDDLEKLSKELEKEPNNESLLKRYGSLENEFRVRNGYDYEYLISTMVNKFGFSNADYNRKIATFSGGERNKIAFTKLLLSKPDLLILDEPTNHLDVETIEWLEDYLHSYEGAVLIVSHDRYFIDKVCDGIVEIANKTSDVFAGNYSYYLDEKVKRYEQQLLAYNLQEEEIARLKMIIEKNKHKGNYRLVKIGLDREKKLAKIEKNRIESPKISSKTIHLNLKTVDERRVRQFSTSELSFGYDKPLTNNSLDISVFFGDKIGIVGPNGIGKTTLLKTLAFKLPMLSGKIVKHRELRMGYIDQNQIQISSSKTVFDYFHDDYPMLSNFEVRSKLGAFLFSGEDVFKRVDDLSGGEKVRVSFAKLMMKRYDILFLDEPTNHLDMETRKVLESALLEYPGTIIFVSHDRYFIDELAKHLIVINNNELSLFDGNYTDLLESKKHASNENLSSIETKNEENVKIKAARSDGHRSRLSLEKLGNKISKLEQEIADLKELMFEEEYYNDQRKMDELDEKILDKKIELDKLSQEYLERQE